MMHEMTLRAITDGSYVKNTHQAIMLAENFNCCNDMKEISSGALCEMKRFDSSGRYRDTCSVRVHTEAINSAAN